MHFQSPSVNNVEPLPSLEDLDNTVFGVTDRKRRLSVIGKLHISIALIVKTYFYSILFMRILLSTQTVSSTHQLLLYNLHLGEWILNIKTSVSNIYNTENYF